MAIFEGLEVIGKMEMTKKRKIVIFTLMCICFIAYTGSVFTFKMLDEMGSHRQHIESFWGSLYSLKDKQLADERLAKNPPDGLKAELRVLFQRVYLPPGGPSISKDLVNVCLDNPIDLLPFYISPKGEMSVLCGISEPYDVIPVTLEKSLSAHLIVALSESKPNYFDSNILLQAELEKSDLNVSKVGD